MVSFFFFFVLNTFGLKEANLHFLLMYTLKREECLFDKCIFQPNTCYFSVQ